MAKKRRIRGKKFANNNGCEVAYADVIKAVKAEKDGVYKMNMISNSDDAQNIIAMVNIGIDSRLEACFCPDRGDKFEYRDGRLYCEVSPESFPVLVRRLFENDDDEGERGLLAGDMLQTLGFNDTGEFVGCEDE